LYRCLFVAEAADNTINIRSMSSNTSIVFVVVVVVQHLSIVVHMITRSYFNLISHPQLFLPPINAQLTTAFDKDTNFLRPSFFNEPSPN
jgi:hypothetical protein